MAEAFFDAVKFFGFLAALFVLIYGGQLLYGMLFDTYPEPTNKLPRIGCFLAFIFGMVWLLFMIVKC